MTSASTRNGYGSACKIYKVSITGTTAANGQPRKTRFEMCSQLFCSQPREIHGPTVMKILSCKAVVQRLTENERWRTIGMPQNGWLSRCTLPDSLTCRLQWNLDIHYWTHRSHFQSADGNSVVNNCLSLPRTTGMGESSVVCAIFPS